MNQQVLEKVYDLVDEIKESSAYKRLMELQEIIATNTEIHQKIQDFQVWNDKYNEVKKYGKYHPDLAKTQQAFRDAKLSLYQDPIVAEYKSLEQTLQQQLDEISRTLATTISAKIKHPNEVGMIKRH